MSGREAQSVSGRAIARIVAGAVVGIGAIVHAAEQAAPDKTASKHASPGASISAAKREFEAMKAARDPAQQQKGALPKLGLPEMHQSTNEPRPWASQKEKLDPAAKKSPNWLLEAMEKGERKGRAGERGGRERSRDEHDEADAELDPLTGERLTREGSPRESDRATAAEHDPREETEKSPVVNPLSQYLGQWMTPRDYAVLKPGIESSLSAQPSGVASEAGLAGVALPAIGGVGGSEILRSAGILSPGSSPAIAAPRENPYLQPMLPPPATGPVGSASVFSAPLVPPAAVVPSLPATASIAAPPPVVVPPQPKIPDFAKPAHDERYFKQLKRF